jgi:anaerobic ribonucleoside-triphosphate reductase activating protein
MTFTGHEPEELRGTGARALLAELDVLVTGRFVLAERDLTLPWRGSRNQRVLFLTDRYSEADALPGSQCELHLDDTGEVRVTGFPPDELLELLRR